MTPQQHLENLAKLLSETVLPTRDGGKRQAGVSEFEFLSAENRGDSAWFKHTNTRNYIRIRYAADGSSRLSIPNNGEPHRCGYFDHP
jgi:hypothetical protein